MPEAVETANGVHVAAARSAPRINRLYSGEEAPLNLSTAWRVLVKAWPFISEHRRLVILKCSLILIAVAFYLAGPWPLKIIIDNVIDGRPLTGWPAAILVPIVGTSRAELLVAVTVFMAFTLIVIGSSGDPPLALSTSVGGLGLDQAGATTDDANTGNSNWNGLFGYLETAVTIRLTQNINQSVRTAVYRRFLAAPLTLYGDQKIGDAVFRAMNDSAT